MPKDLARSILRREWETLNRWEQRVLEAFRERRPVSRNIQKEHEDRLTLGERVADRVAMFGGSWTFISLFVAGLAAWVLTNAWVLATRAFDPYPFILLNLLLSCLAAMQAPVILMSQNRLAAKDRLRSEHDYEINLKAELEILELHSKLDQVMGSLLKDVVEQQQRLLERQEVMGRRLEALSGRTQLPPES